MTQTTDTTPTDTTHPDITRAHRDHRLTAELIELSNRFGADPAYVRAGGGNSSVKIDGILHIKPSGTPLATLTADDLVPLRNDVLLQALASDEEVEGDPVRAAAQKAQVGNPTRRPSVEILFHALIDDPLVLHLHPVTANALTCNEDGESLAAELLGDDAVWVPYIDPGVPLAVGVQEARAAYTQRMGNKPPKVTLLGNHGIIVAGASAADITAETKRVTALIAGAIDAADPVPAAPEQDAARTASVINAVAPRLRGLLGSDAGPAVVTADTSDLARSITAEDAIVTGGPMIPDQIVYAGSFPLVVDLPDPEAAADTLATALAAHRAEHGRDPVVTVLPGIGVLGAGTDLAKADNALRVYLDHAVVARDADRIGRVRAMDARERRFIETWEAEAYRQAQAAQGAVGRLAGRVALVTGAAQGFGLGITEALLAEGASVLLADLNIELATANAERLASEHGAGRARAVAMNVADADSCEAAVAKAVQIYGGIDLLVSNAGIVRSEGVMSQPVADFDLVTNVNYRGYFLCVRAVAPVMAAQRGADPSRWLDIVEVNSKSGLEGSKRNFAYAGSKFGGIGLTQSFALELVEYGIKVNAVCPGNFLDGPLWSDPERGLFVQYLAAGKVPGATTVEDVRRFYEAKVPMGRGCTPADVARAIVYIVEQTYETGQAVPVTGGQNMLN
ncbi:SDR family NAD(P)-dependent oxidoreductase [Propioniciclava soli]|uniref:SDR family NAD(P)-dependent oxidoreductase n=1 Tax=Propioniciclava soli TaxID=2775081 RepID=UPI001E4E27A3|nr:SDR family NAD(P)-dependent oxidoreductase [Propioniciclava soli]